MTGALTLAPGTSESPSMSLSMSLSKPLSAVLGRPYDAIAGARASSDVGGRETPSSCTVAAVYGRRPLGKTKYARCRHGTWPRAADERVDAAWREEEGPVACDDVLRAPGVAARREHATARTRGKGRVAPGRALSCPLY